MKISRIQFIIRSLTQGGGVRLKDIEKEYEISRRQACRDIEYLRDQLGAPIEYDYKVRRYVLTDPWVSYTDLDERMIIMGSYIKSLLENMPLGPLMAEELNETLLNGMSSRARSVVGKVVYRAPSLDMPDYKVFSAITTAIADNTNALISYVNSKGIESEREVEPKRLINYEGSWYMACFDYKNSMLRNFHLSRIRSIVVSAEKQSHSDEKEIEGFISSGFGIFLGGTTEEYRIRFTGKSAFTVSSQIWHPKQRIEAQEDGSIIMSIPAASPSELIGRVLSFAPEAIPLSPKEFVDEYRQRLEAALKAF